MYLYQTAFWKNAMEAAGIVSVIFDDNKNIIATHVAHPGENPDEFVKQYGGYNWKDADIYHGRILAMPLLYKLTPGAPIVHRKNNE